MSDDKDPKESAAPEAEAPKAAPVPDEPKAEAKKVEAEPVEAVEAKPVEAKPVEAKPVEIKPVEAKPAETKHVEAPVAKRIEALDAVEKHGSAAEPAAAASGVRVRVAYAHGSTVEGPTTDARSRLKPRRLLAEYDTTAEVIHAAESLRDAGYKGFEAHSPFPIHGMDAAMGLADSKLGWIVLACGLTGVTSAWVMMFWMNGVDYPLIIGGKPPGTLPSMVPIMFELTVLLSSFGAVFGMFGLNRLPQHHDVLFYSDRFAAFSNDKFFISVDATDPKFDLTKTRQLLEKTKPEVIEVIETIEEVPS